ncbi:MAG: arginine--tRNA ligase [Candidatus Vogelbacteria bacterium]|nr:arginine--tRNA ligase [Candidatus Vogelbacteria bacterium]
MKSELEKLVGGPVEAPKDLSHGDYMTSATLASDNPRAEAEEIVAKLQSVKHPMLDKIEVAGPGFINFYLAPQVFADEIQKVISEKENYGKGENLKGQRVIIEYTDPNPFKEFHLGHLMSNTVGEAISRLIEFSGAEVRRACYQGDVGLHVAKTLWAGGDYALGSKKYDEDESAKTAIQEINKKLYDRSDDKINQIYDEGKKLSLEKFEQIYRQLGTKFDFYFFESQTGEFGKQVVEENIGKVFEKSAGAIVFRGDEKAGLHTRVFINSEGLPTYEAKELGLAKIKYDKYPYDQSVVVTGNEINVYFRVLLEAMSLVFPELAAKTKHVSHGMLRLPGGKMSSRTGNVITAESLISEVAKSARGQEAVAVAAIKYSILKQSPGKDIIFDLGKSLSVAGDSGPYLQYAYVRAKSVLAKAGSQGPTLGQILKVGPLDLPSQVERLLIHFPEITARAAREFAPNYVITYLIELASAFNAYYAKNKIIGGENESYQLALTAAVAQVLQNGLWLLGIAAPEKM